MNPYAINVRATPIANPSRDPEKKEPESKDPESLARAKKTGPEFDPADKPLEDLYGMMDEISWSEQDVLQSYLPFGNNPDPIVRSKGLKIYQEMQHDEQIKVCLDVRTQARLSTPWEILPGLPGNRQSEEMAKMITHCLKRMRGNFESDLEQIYSAVSYGFSISEKIFEYIEAGEFKGKIGLKAIKTREPFNYDFKVDTHGNMLGLVYIGLAGEDKKDGDLGSRMPLSSIGTIIPAGGRASLDSRAGRMNVGTIENPFPPEKFIVYSYNQQFGNHYGRSELLGAFRWWLMKKHGAKFWAIWLERYASPFIWAQYKRDAGLKKEALQKIDDFLRNLSSRQSVRVSDAVTLFPIQFNSQNGDSYEKAIEAYNRYIAHSILFPNLIGFTGGQGSSGGSYSLGQKQFDAFLWILEKMGRDTSETIVGEQIIKPLIAINYGDVDTDMMPKFRFVSVEDAKIETRARIVQSLTSAGVITAEEEWVRDFLTIPKKDPDIVLPPNALETAAARGEGGEEEEEKPGGGEAEEKKPAAEKKDPEPKEEKKDEEKKTENKFKERTPSRFEEKMRVKQFQAELDALDKGFFDDASEAIEEMRDELLERVIKKKVIESADAAVVSDLTVNPKRLKETVERWLVKAYLDAKLRQLEELAAGGLDVQIVKKFEAPKGSQPWEPLPPREAIEFFRRKVLARVTTADGVRKIIDLTTGADITYFRNKAFTIAGTVRDDILNDARQIILNGIKRQDHVGTVKNIKDMFNRYLDQGIEVDEELLRPSRLNTIVRTNMTEAINEGRAAMMRDKDVGEFVQFFQYTAIMDQRTTDYCRCMDGKNFRIEDLDQIRPPAHYNCRSFTVPITQFEVDDLKEEGRGVEVSQPCADRAAGFEDIKRDTVPVSQEPEAKPKVPKVPEKKETPATQDLPAAPRSKEDIEATERLRAELSEIVVRCPYTACHSQDIKFNGKRLNIGEYTCERCEMPFRVSTKGDLYLYDAGMETWERATIGAAPLFFKEKGTGK